MSFHRFSGFLRVWHFDLRGSLPLRVSLSPTPIAEFHRQGIVVTPSSYEAWHGIVMEINSQSKSVKYPLSKVNGIAVGLIHFQDFLHFLNYLFDKNLHILVYLSIFLSFNSPHFNR